MNDPEHWDKPEQFNPDRFIDESTGKFRKNERCIPFLVGKRSSSEPELLYSSS